MPAFPTAERFHQLAHWLLPQPWVEHTHAQPRSGCVKVLAMARSYSAVHVHLVFSTKDLYPFLTDPDAGTEMHRYLGGISKTLGYQPLTVGGVADHVQPKTKSARKLMLASAF